MLHSETVTIQFWGQEKYGTWEKQCSAFPDMFHSNGNKLLLHSNCFKLLQILVTFKRNKSLLLFYPNYCGCYSIKCCIQTVTIQFWGQEKYGTWENRLNVQPIGFEIRHSDDRSTFPVLVTLILELLLYCLNSSASTASTINSKQWNKNDVSNTQATIIHRLSI